MNHKVEKQHRRSIRLKGYDYANSGAYFVTIVTQGRACLFGEIVNAETRLNDAGSVIERWWFELNNKFRTVETDEFVIMPNHFHGIVVIADVGADLRVGPVGKGAHGGAPLQRVTQQRVTQPTTRMGTGAGVNPNVHPAHQGTHAGVPLQGTHPVRPVAQRNYYEHVIRDEYMSNRIREYILNNPAQWTYDPENPAATAAEPPDLRRLQERCESKGDRPVAPTEEFVLESTRTVRTEGEEEGVNRF